MGSSARALPGTSTRPSRPARTASPSSAPTVWPEGVRDAASSASSRRRCRTSTGCRWAPTPIATPPSTRGQRSEGAPSGTSSAAASDVSSPVGESRSAERSRAIAGGPAHAGGAAASSAARSRGSASAGSATSDGGSRSGAPAATARRTANGESEAAGSTGVVPPDQPPAVGRAHDVAAEQADTPLARPGHADGPRMVAGAADDGPFGQRTRPDDLRCPVGVAAPPAARAVDVGEERVQRPVPLRHPRRQGVPAATVERPRHRVQGHRVHCGAAVAADGDLATAGTEGRRGGRGRTRQVGVRQHGGQHRGCVVQPTGGCHHLVPSGRRIAGEGRHVGAHDSRSNQSRARFPG